MSEVERAKVEELRGWLERIASHHRTVHRIKPSSEEPSCFYIDVNVRRVLEAKP